MKKRIYILLTLLAIYIFVIEYIFYPEYILRQESEGLFLTTNDYLQNYLFTPGSWILLLTNFIQQFYHSLPLGLFIETILILSSTISMFLYLQKWEIAHHSIWIISIPSIMFCVYQNTWGIPALLQYCFTLSMLTFYISISHQTTRFIYSVMLLPFLYLLIPSNCFILIYLYMCIYEWTFFKSFTMKIISISIVLLACLYPLFWQNINYTSALLYHFSPEPDMQHVQLYYILYLLPVIPILLSKWKGNLYFSYVLVGFLFIFGSYSIYKSSYCEEKEKRFAIQRYAEEKKWNQILQAISNTPYENNPFFHPYLMLALNEQRMLPEKLFHYPIFSANQIYFPANESDNANFNSLFAYSIGLKQEAIHQLAQANAMSPHGLSFSRLRRMIDWYIELKNVSLAEKYLAILQTSTCHNQWIKKRISQLSTIKKDTTFKTNKDFIIDASSPLIFLTQVIKTDTTNRKALDYLLCGILLGKDLKGFYNVFQAYFPKNTPIPIHYQEALLVVDLMFPQLKVTQQYSISSTCKQAFEEFGKWMAQRPNTNAILKQKYGNTYWYYGFIRTVT